MVIYDSFDLVDCRIGAVSDLADHLKVLYRHKLVLFMSVNKFNP